MHTEEEDRPVRPFVELEMETTVEASEPPKTKWLEIALWFIVSAVVSTYANTAFLREFNGDAVGLTLIRFLGSAILGLIANVMCIGGPSISIGSVPEHIKTLIGPAIFLVGANLFNSISLDRGGITLTYVVKAGIPLVTVVICLVKRQWISLKVALTLIPTVVGVALSAWADTEFTWDGFIAAWLSTISQALMNVTSKSGIQKSGLSGQRFQFVLVTIASAITIALDAVFGLIHWGNILKNLESNESAKYVFVLAAVAYHVEYVLNFVVTGNVSEVHFSVLDVARRLGIIVAGAFLFGKILSALNVFGVVLALSGVLAFNEARRRELLDVQHGIEKKNS